jgi:hypothetical protein
MTSNGPVATSPPHGPRNAASHERSTTPTRKASVSIEQYLIGRGDIDDPTDWRTEIAKLFAS